MVSAERVSGQRTSRLESRRAGALVPDGGRTTSRRVMMFTAWVTALVAPRVNTSAASAATTSQTIWPACASTSSRCPRWRLSWTVSTGRPRTRPRPPTARRRRLYQIQRLRDCKQIACGCVPVVSKRPPITASKAWVPGRRRRHCPPQRWRRPAQRRPPRCASRAAPAPPPASRCCRR